LVSCGGLEPKAASRRGSSIDRAELGLVGSRISGLELKMLLALNSLFRVDRPSLLRLDGSIVSKSDSSGMAEN
jgi:hypothetical protein